MVHKAYIPSKLVGIVDLIWEQEMEKPGTFTILPSGKVEIIFPFYPVKQLQAVKISARDNPVNNYSCFLSGLHTRPLKMEFDRFHALGIQMKPVSVKALFGIPLSKIRNYFVEGSLIIDDFAFIQEQLFSGKTFLERAKCLEDFLLSIIQETSELHEALHLDRCIRKLIHQNQFGAGRSVQNMMGYSRTHTFRLFNDWFGTSAHSYQNLIQFVRATAALHQPGLKLTAAGLYGGYYDQSHFIRKFQAYAAMTPGAYRKQMSGLPGLLFG
ncbi:AraC-type DNA-binding protein [Cyclobacterium lianum]|uniref:AraC-type DNA-binding protein n=1 Tax=Cyclobacterium lianum TaxID=388280 RepID=A0A1M7QTI5_9BACT|nr:AraC family transcriptional regulator [Cyclobacterium lianum]SHN35128.1 AraC-type DNA-binding protein [Cyclobacterium lianum]